MLPEWVSSGVYVLDDECIERLPERGDHEDSTFPELAAEGKLLAYRNTGLLAHREHAEAAARSVRVRAPAHPELAPRAAEPAR